MIDVVEGLPHRSAAGYFSTAYGLVGVCGLPATGNPGP
jgi:hypothetical protein